MPINFLLTRHSKAIVVADLCLKGMCLSSVLLHCTIVSLHETYRTYTESNPSPDIDAAVCLSMVMC